MTSPYKCSDIAAECSSAAETSVGFTKKQTKPPISDMWKHIESRRLIKNQLHSTHDPAKKFELSLLYKSADSEVKERSSSDKEAFYNKIASEAEAAAYRNDLRSIYVNQQTNECRTAYSDFEGLSIILLTVDEQIKE